MLFSLLPLLSAKVALAELLGAAFPFGFLQHFLHDLQAEFLFVDVIVRGVSRCHSGILRFGAADLIERDRRDMTRDLSPLILTEGTIHIDNTNMTIDEEVDLIYNIIKGN